MLFFKLKDKEKKIEAHLLDIRKNLLFSFLIFLFAFIIVFLFSPYIYGFLTRPLIEVLNIYESSKDPFIVTNLTEGLFTYLKISFWSTLFFLFPLFLWQFLFYIFPTIHNKFKKELIVIGGCMSPICFYIGCIFAYICMFNVVWCFLVKFNLTRNLSLYLKISEYINLSISILILMGVVFELPIVLYFLFRFNIVSYKTLKKLRKLVIIISFIVAAIFTPPDPFSQIILALVLITLYEISLILIKKQHNKLFKIK